MAGMAELRKDCNEKIEVLRKELLDKAEQLKKDELELVKQENLVHSVVARDEAARLYAEAGC